jgi:hypothetical protein
MRCSHCGSNLSAEDLTQSNCKYCGTVLPHHARAAERAAAVKQILADANQNGIPDIVEGAFGGFGDVGPGVAGTAAVQTVVSTTAPITASSASVVVVNGIVQQGGELPIEVKTALANAGVSIAGITPAPVQKPVAPLVEGVAAASRARLALWLAVGLSAIAIAALVAVVLVLARAAGGS